MRSSQPGHASTDGANGVHSFTDGCGVASPNIALTRTCKHFSHVFDRILTLSVLHALIFGVFGRFVLFNPVTLPAAAAHPTAPCVLRRTACGSGWHAVRGAAASDRSSPHNSSSRTSARALFSHFSLRFTPTIGAVLFGCTRPNLTLPPPPPTHNACHTLSKSSESNVALFSPPCLLRAVRLPRTRVPHSYCMCGF